MTRHFGRRPGDLRNFFWYLDYEWPFSCLLLENRTRALKVSERILVILSLFSVILKLSLDYLKQLLIIILLFISKKIKTGLFIFNSHSAEMVFHTFVSQIDIDKNL